MITIITTIITSGIITTIIAGIFSIFLGRNQYRYEYYKMLIQKRIETFDLIQELLQGFSVCVIDPDDKKLYHCIFSNEKNPIKDKYLMSIFKLTKANFYISNETSETIFKMNRFFIENKIEFDNIEDGKKYYFQIGELVDDILKSTRKEVLDSYNLKKLLKEKQNLGKVRIKL